MRWGNRLQYRNIPWILALRSDCTLHVDIGSSWFSVCPCKPIDGTSGSGNFRSLISWSVKNSPSTSISSSLTSCVTRRHRLMKLTCPAVKQLPYITFSFEASLSTVNSASFPLYSCRICIVVYFLAEGLQGLQEPGKDRNKRF